MSVMVSVNHFWHTAQISTYGRCVYGNPHGCPRIHFRGGKGAALTVEIYDALLENYPGTKLYIVWLRQYSWNIKKMLTSFAFSKPAGKYILSYTFKNQAFPISLTGKDQLCH